LGNSNFEATGASSGPPRVTPIFEARRYQIELAAAHPETVLLLGATGTGKELVARAIHHLSSRAKLPFVPINCTAIPDALFESELFGQEKGAFTGADSKHVGLFEQAHRGTLFLDEIGDLHADKQVKLLRFLEEPCIHRLGGQRYILLDIRVVAATHRNLHRAIEAGTFREDLYYRLSALTIRTPTLSERPDDIWDLVRHFLRKLQTHQPGVEVPIRREAIEFLEQQTWPGNVRQLEQSVRRALLLTQGQPILLRHVQQACDPNQEARIERRRAGEESLTDLIERAKKGEVNDLHARVVEQAERSLISRAMLDFKGSQSTLARLLGITPKTLRRKLRHLKILVTRKARGS
jgi:DNA-binding NtrC family response regulator